MRKQEGNTRTQWPKVSPCPEGNNLVNNDNILSTYSGDPVVKAARGSFISL